MYVEDGLEPALNIDRDSFRETDVHYQAMRAHVWELLRKKIFPEFKSRSKKLRDERHETHVSQYQELFAEKLSKLSAPLAGKIKLGPVIEAEAEISTWIGVDGSNVIVDRAKWEAFAERNNITGETQERFFRVLQVLISSEVLSEANVEEADALLDALAIAIQD